jgi:CDP-diacylglycerol pyrophosphatase
VIQAARITVLASILSVLAGCRAAQKPITVVPNRCMHQMTVTDFSKPCIQIPGQPNEALCDKVHIHFACLEYRASEAAR